MRNRNWVLLVVAIFALVGLFVLWQWWLDRRASADTDRMIARLRSTGQEVEQYANEMPPIPDPPLPSALEQHRALIAERTKTFVEAMRELRMWAEGALPHTPEARRQEVRDALAECAACFDRALQLLKQRADRVREIAGNS